MTTEKPIRRLPKDLPTISDRIEYLRCATGYPVRTFTVKVGAYPTFMQKVLKGETEPTMKLVNNILNVFPFVTKEWLFLGVGEPFDTDDISAFMYNNKKSSDIDEGMNERFKEIRLDKGLSQPVFAAKLGITKDVVVFIETKKSNISIPLIKRLAKEYGVSEMWMLYGIGNKYKLKK